MHSARRASSIPGGTSFRARSTIGRSAACARPTMISRASGTRPRRPRCSARSGTSSVRSAGRRARRTRASSGTRSGRRRGGESDGSRLRLQCAIDACRGRAGAAARRRGLAVHRGTPDDFQPARRYALITAFDVIEHLPEPAAFLRRLAGWLAPSGLLALTLPDIASVPARAMGRHWYYYAPPDHVHYFTPATIRALVAAHGFRDVRVEPFRKPLRLAYAVENLVRFNPRLGALAGAVARRLPRAWRARAWRLPL